ncbi:hypothetical protein [Paenibacillus sp. TSA_86.1]|uniref:hypothetical protein n=1 Tax=Paenibacillus sp. TSA_86.1 TaxID=3415649 RepID=UPI0040452885
MVKHGNDGIDGVEGFSGAVDVARVSLNKNGVDWVARVNHEENDFACVEDGQRDGLLK